MDQPDIFAAAHRTLKCNIEIHDPQLVFDERSAGLAILAAPFDVGEFDTVAIDEQSRSTVSECIDHRCRTRCWVVVELGTRPIDVAGVEKTIQTIIGAIERAPYQWCNMCRTQEAMSRKLANDFNIVIGQSEGWRFRRTAEPRPPHLATRPIFHKLDETIRGHVFCSFLALVLKKALEDRIAALDRSGSWPEIIADLDSLTETEIEHDGQRFMLRSPPRPLASLALRAIGIALPPTVRQAAAD
jgi:hypothetical protein